MAGIGFELRKMIHKESLLSLIKVYSYSGLLSSGPWVISILAILAVGFIHIFQFGSGGESVHFQIIITYAFVLASSLIVTGFIQLPFTRYVADLIFAERSEEVSGSFFGVLFVVWLTELLLFAPLVPWLLPHLSATQHIMIIATFLTLSGVWIANILVSSLKYYHATIAAYFVSYGLIMFASWRYGESLDALLFIFYSGNALLMVVMITLIVKSYRPSHFMHFGFFNRKRLYYSLGFAGLFYNMGTWADKVIFWYHPLTGEAVLDAIHASVVYDLPVFLAYLSILPGMAIFFYRLEADFAEQYDRFYDNVRGGGTLHTIRFYRNEMVRVIRHAVREIIVVQSIVNITLFLGAPWLFELLRIPQLYLGLFYVLTIGAQLQLGFMSLLALLHYLDQRHKAMVLSFLFFLLNSLLTLYTIYLGPAWFGYGYALSLLIVFTLSLVVIRTTMQRLDYETFMLQ
ncbi:MAG: exopolysaccharide Pel transporter PelG [Campylobacterales bacterium]|nr:exopolysaccharide Pel transporter PelG [Campylobacterales bacterium]